MKLMLLRCPQCQAPLEPEQLDVVVSCRHCFTAVAIDESGLQPIPVQYAASKRREAEGVRWVPFWVFNGRVNITKRETQGGGGLFGGGSGEEFWSVPRHLYTPAWNLEMPMAREMGQKFTQDQTALKAIPRPNEVQLISATVTAADALKLLEFIVLSIEAQRKDWLKSLAFRIEAKEPELWALPANEQGSRWVFHLA